MVRHRVRLRFRKEGDLRWISHRDLARTLERMFRRAGLPLSMSEGFHPKPRMSFPLALAVGIAGLDEVMELELSEEQTAEQVLATLQSVSPPGLSFTSADVIPPGTRKTQVRQVTYETPLPPERHDVARAAVAAWLAEPTHVVRRASSGNSVDVRSYVDSLAVVDGLLRFDVRVCGEGSARPREVLEAVGLTDLEQHGLTLARVRVEVLP